jgi:phospholipid/cholesterol/gamma-HCH transport system substrate-binding protein
MTIARAVAVGALTLAVVVVAFLLLRGGGGTEYKLRLQTASGLVKNNEVQVGGRKVGSIKNIDLTDDNQAEVTISLDDAFAPLHEGTTATTRALSLSGIANRYIALSPGPNNAKALPDGATLTTEKTTSLVDLDQLFDAFDAPTRNGLRNVIQGFAAQYSGRTLNGQVTSSEFNRSTQYFSPFLSSTDALVQQLLRDQPALNRFLVDTSRVVTTLSTRRDDLSALVGNANTTAAAIASEDASLSQTLGQLPTTLRKANTTFVNLRSTLDDLDVLVNASKPATKRLEPFLKALRPLVADAKPTIRDLRRLIREPGDANDAIDLLNRAPALATAGRRAFPSTVAALQGSQEVVQYLRPFGPEAIGFLRDFGQTASNYDANGHFARIQPIFNAFQLDPSGSVLTAVPPALRGLGAQTGLTERCPGAASQPRPDGSNPFLDGGRLVPGTDCDPSQVPPGP